MCTPTSLALVRASFRATANNNRGGREEDREEDAAREQEEGASERAREKKEGGFGITSANRSSQETGDELQK